MSREIVDYILISDLRSNKIEKITSTDRLLTNDKNKTVISFTDGGNCCTHQKTINKWRNDSLVEIRRLERTYGTETENDLIEEFTIKNDKEVKIKTKKMSFEEAEKYFEKYQ